jgi:hypothetical protein
MKAKTIDRIAGAFVFIWALVLYCLTVAPTTSFWDPGEFIAIANRLEVSHPPGSPVYMLLGRIASMFVPASYVALSVNLISVLASAVTVLLTHLIIVRLIRHWRGHPSNWSPADRIVGLGGGMIGALTFAATDSFWFNAVEAEVYALSMLFTALVVWLIMKWSEQIRRQDESYGTKEGHAFGLAADRYLVLIAYLFGLATGIHLLNLLAVFYIGLIIYFTRFDRPELEVGDYVKGIVLTGLASAGVFLMIYPGMIQGLPTLGGNVGSPVIFLILLVLGVIGAIYYTQKHRMRWANIAALSIAMILIGYSCYALIFIRSAADPPIDENDPETSESIVSYLKREQYGSTPLLRGNTYSNELGRIDQEETTWFPRRHSSQPRHAQEYAKYDSDWEFFWQYQVGHMYLRYFAWQFIGKAKDVQDSGWITGWSSVETENYVYETPSADASRNAYFGIPFILGLFGLIYHFSRDWKRALSIAVLFLVAGLGIIVYLNQTPFQPRERDYSYVASFFAFSLWIGIGASGLIELAYDAVYERLESIRPSRTSAAIMGAVLFLAVPGWMTVENYDDHDRSGRYIARDYAYNMLQSLEENAIIFTNGDNDTFPLWYLQEVEGVRQDVRVVNLSLLNTSWYIKQLKNQWSRASAPLPMSFSDDQVEDIQPRQWKPQTITLPVPTNKLRKQLAVYMPDSTEQAQLESPMSWKLEGRQYSQDMQVLYVADLAALDILATNAREGWERPVYFAITTSPGGQLDLQNYFHLEGMAYRVLPIRHNNPRGRIVSDVLLDHLSKFRFTNLDDPDVYYDHTIRRMVDNYRNIFAQLGEQLAAEGRDEEAREVLDRIMEEVPLTTIAGNPSSLATLARAYDAAGDTTRVSELMQAAEPGVLRELRRARNRQQRDQAARFVQMVQFNYIESGNYEAASDFTHRIAEVLNDSSFRQSPAELRELYEQATGDQALPEGPGGALPTQPDTLQAP